VTTGGATRHNYVVTAQVRVRPDQVEYLTPTPLEQLTLISCIGDKVLVRGSLTFTARLVTIAEPTQ
jgi:sortase (surface protein transpeptidase)